MRDMPYHVALFKLYLHRSVSEENCYFLLLFYLKGKNRKYMSQALTNLCDLVQAVKDANHMSFCPHV